MHLPQWDKVKSAQVEPFVIESALERKQIRPRATSGGRAAGRRTSPFEEIFAVAFSPPVQTPESDTPMPEDAIDARDLCALHNAEAAG